MKHTSKKMNKHGIESELFCDRCDGSGVIKKYGKIIIKESK